MACIMLTACTTKARRSTLGLGITQASKSTHSSLRCATWDLRYLMSELVHHTKLNGTARMSMFRFRNERAELGLGASEKTSVDLTPAQSSMRITGNMWP